MKTYKFGVTFTHQEENISGKPSKEILENITVHADVTDLLITANCIRENGALVQLIAHRPNVDQQYEWFTESPVPSYPPGFVHLGGVIESAINSQEMNSRES